MARIFISAGHGGFEDGALDPGAVAGGTTEAEEMKRTRDLIDTELNNRGFTVLSVRDAPTPPEAGRCRLLRDSEEPVELPSR